MYVSCNRNLVAKRPEIGALMLALTIFVGQAYAQSEPPVATYVLQLSMVKGPRISVRATLPGKGAALTMDTTRPGDVPEVADAGWPALVHDLEVTDSEGHAVEAIANGAEGWSLGRAAIGALTLKYEVDYAPLAAGGWPAPREAAYADADHLVVVGRSLFVRAPGQRASEVRFVLPKGWQAATPWSMANGDSAIAVVASADDLSENLVAFVRGQPDVLSASGFNLGVVALGQWQDARPEVRRVLGVALQRLVDMIGFEGRTDYLAALMPQVERGGESYRASFALMVGEAPTASNVGAWGNLIAHEIFHYWNGWRLQGADYASSQWFQEGFTEYVANLALVSGGLIGPEEFYGKLAKHVDNYRKLTTPLDAPGTRKGPPLYGGGALVAFTWDTTIRGATDGKKGVVDVLRALLRDTEDGGRPYAWVDIESALRAVAPVADWAAFRDRYIHGRAPLPLEGAFERVGLRMIQVDDGSTRIETNPTASPTSQGIRRVLVTGGVR